MFAHQLTPTSQIWFPYVGIDPNLIRDCLEVHGALINVFSRFRITREAASPRMMITTRVRRRVGGSFFPSKEFSNKSLLQIRNAKMFE